jgi:hypothetical protein
MVRRVNRIRVALAPCCANVQQDKKQCQDTGRSRDASRNHTRRILIPAHSEKDGGGADGHQCANEESPHQPPFNEEHD